MASWRILVVDDEPLVLRMMQEILKSLPATVLEARDGEEAVRLAGAERPDLIVLDVMMPRMDGFQVITALKQDASTAEIPVIFLSALGASRDKVKGLDLGAEDYLAKPIDPEELRARVRMVLRRAQAPQRDALQASGQLQVMNLVSFVQLFEGERRTARLLLTRGGERGEIAFTDGKITHAVQGPRRGDAAVYQLLTWQDGTFQLGPSESLSQTVGEVKASNQTLLLEGVRRLDEIPALRAGLPGAGVPLMVPAWLRPILARQVRREVAEVVTLLDGTRDLVEVVSESPLDGWTSLKILQHLLKVRALEAEIVAGSARGGLRVRIDMPIEHQCLRLFLRASSFILTAGGVLIRVTASYEVGERTVLRFTLPGREIPVKAVGQVVWRNADPSKPGETDIGIKFLNLLASDREAIEQHLARTVAEQISGLWETR